MKKLFNPILPLLIGCLLSVTSTSCTDENNFEGNFVPALAGHYLNLSTDKVTLGASSPLTSQVDVQSVTTAWQFSGYDNTWLTLNPVTGNSDQSVSVTATENLSGSNLRTSVFTFASTDPAYDYNQSIAVTQSAAKPYITVKEQSITFPAAAATRTVDIEANVEWTLQNDAPWLTVEVSTDKKSITFSTADNLTQKPLQTQVVISGGGLTAIISVTQSAPTTPQASPSSIDMTISGGDYELNVTSDVEWTASPSEQWLTINPDHGKNGTTQMQLHADAITSVKGRSAFVYFYVGNNQVLTIPVAQEALSLSLSTDKIELTADADQQQMQLSCNTSWEVSEKPSWLTVTPTSGSGNASLTLSVADYWNSTDLKGTLKIGRKNTDMEAQVSVTQKGRIVPEIAKQLTFGCNASSQKIELATDARWTAATSGESWLHLSQSQGTGAATLTVSADENTVEDERQATLTITIADITQTVKVIQHGITPYIDLEKTTLAITAAAQRSTVSVNANIAWTVSTKADWLTATASTDSKSIIIEAKENLTGNKRDAVVTISGSNITKTITVTQAPPSSLDVSPTSIDVEHTGGKFELSITSEVAWTAASSEDWLTISPAAGQNGTTKIVLQADATATVNSRSAFVNISIGGAVVHSVPVNQKGLSLRLSTNNIELTADADQQQMQLSCNTSWEVIEKPSWLTVTPTSGDGNASLTLSVADYWNSTDLKGTLKIGRKNTDMEAQVSVTQKGRIVPEIAKQLTFGCNASSQKIELATDARWTAATSGGSWLHLSQSQGTGAATLTVSADENTVEDERQATLTITIADITQTVKVIQHGITPYIDLEKTTLAITAAAQRSTVSVNANIAWTVSTKADWLTATASTDSKSIIIEAKENLTDSKRDAVVTVSGSNITKTTTVTQAKPDSPTSSTTETLKFESSGGIYQLTITSEVSWTASTPDTWLDVAPMEGQAGESTLAISATPNTQTTSREGHVYISIGERRMLTIPIYQDGIYIELSDNNVTFTADAQAKKLTVKSNTTWQLQQKPDWLTVAPTNGNGTTELTLSASDNWGTTTRQGILKIGQEGSTLAVQATMTQAGRTFPDLIGQLLFDHEADTKTVSIETNGQWTASATTDWITLSPSSGTGNTNMQVSVTENTGADERLGVITVTVGDISRQIAVEQKGKYFTVDPSASVQLTSKGGTHSVSITTNEQWTATPSTTWMTADPASGKGDATVTLTAADNPSINARNDTTTIAPANLQAVRIVTLQAARYLEVNPTSIPFHSKGGSTIVTVKTDATYTIETTATWLSIVQGTGNTFTVTATSNNTDDTREATIVVAMTGLVNGEAYQLAIPVTQTAGKQIEIQPFGDEQQWDITTGTITIKVTGFATDKSWDDISRSKVTVTVEGFHSDKSWDDTSGSNVTGGVTDFGTENAWDDTSGSKVNVGVTNFNTESSWDE